MLSSVLLFLSLAAVAAPRPVYHPASAVSPALHLSDFHPLAVVLSLFPLPVLVALKYVYVRFRRGQSIHAVDTVYVPKAATNSSVPPERPSLTLYNFNLSSTSFWSSLHPYIVGTLGSPDWETTISCRINNTLRRTVPRPRPSPPTPLIDVSGTTANASTVYSTWSTKSRATVASNDLSSMLTDKARSRMLTTEAGVLFSPALRLPPSAYLMPSAVPVAVHDTSPTLMQIMEPVFSSLYPDGVLNPPILFLNDKSISGPNASSQNNSTSTGDSSALFSTSLASPASPTMPFTELRKQHASSTASSLLSISAASLPSLPSPASVSLAVFHSPLAPSIPVPKPVYTPSLRPESCLVLSRDWQADKDSSVAQALLQSPTHRSPGPGLPTVFDCLTKDDTSSTRPLNISKTSGNTKSPRYAPGSPTTVPSGAAQSASKPLCSRSASPAMPSIRSSACRSWDLTDLADLDGKLDVDAVSRALGIGLGLGFASRSSGSSMISAIGYESPISTSAAFSPSPEGEMDEGENEQEEDRSPSLCPGSCSRSMDWAAGTHDAGLGAVSVHMHVHGMPLCVIPEETRSEVGSIVGSVEEINETPADSDRAEANAGLAHEVGPDEEGNVSIPGVVVTQPSIVWDESWREGESARLSIGVAW